MEPSLTAHHCPVLTHLCIPPVYFLHFPPPGTSPEEAPPVCQARMDRQNLEEFVSTRNRHFNRWIVRQHGNWCIRTEIHSHWTLDKTLREMKFSLVLSYLCVAHTSYHLLIAVDCRLPENVSSPPRSMAVIHTARDTFFFFTQVNFN